MKAIASEKPEPQVCGQGFKRSFLKEANVLPCLQ